MTYIPDLTERYPEGFCGICMDDGFWETYPVDNDYYEGMYDDDTTEEVPHEMTGKRYSFFVVSKSNCLPRLFNFTVKRAWNTVRYTDDLQGKHDTYLGMESDYGVFLEIYLSDLERIIRTNDVMDAEKDCILFWE